MLNNSNCRAIEVLNSEADLLMVLGIEGRGLYVVGKHCPDELYTSFEYCAAMAS